MRKKKERTFFDELFEYCATLVKDDRIQGGSGENIFISITYEFSKGISADDSFQLMHHKSYRPGQPFKLVGAQVVVLPLCLTKAMPVGAKLIRLNQS